MPSLYALITAVGDYPVAGHKLRGCAADFLTINDLLERQARLHGLDYHPLTLQDAEATRAAIIDGFDHFSRAGADDFCVFYFSGHGSFAPVGDAFHNNASGRNESLVCYDSRQPGGRDLMDKELAYLAHRSMQAGQPTFVSILDCCHSGSAFRSAAGATDAYAKDRQTPAAGRVPVEEYLGYADYHEINGKKQPPLYPAIHLAACRPHQLAQERTINRTPQGVFTYCLNRELTLADPLLSAEELMRRINGRVTVINPKQSPYLEDRDPQRRQRPLFAPASGAAARSTNFFSHRFQIDYRGGHWSLNAGAQQGIQLGTDEYPTRLVEKDGSVWRVTSVEPMRSRVSPEAARAVDKNKMYTVSLRENGREPLSVGLHPDLPTEWVEAFRALADQYPALDLDFTGKEATGYRIDELVGSAILVRPGHNYPLFERVEILGGGSLLESVATFLNELNSVAAWEAVRAIANPNTHIPDTDLSIEITVRDGNPIDQVITDPVEPVLLRYHRRDETDFAPVYFIKITNNVQRPYWVSGVLASSDFGITNEFLPDYEIAPGQSYTLAADTGIEGYLHDDYQSWGVTEIQDYFQFFISTHHDLETSVFNQDALDLDVAGPDVNRSEVTNKGGRRPATPRQNARDWTVKSLPLRIVRPLEAVAINGDVVASLDKIRIEAPAGFSARAKLSTLSAGDRSLVQPLPPTLAAGGLLALNSLSSNRELSDDLNVFELTHIENREAVSAAEPLKLRLPQTFAENESVIPFALDPESGFYYPLGYLDEYGEVLIQDLPAEVAEDRSLLGSLKIFFQKVVGTKVGVKSKYPLLRRVVENQDKILEYAPDNLDAIQAAVADPATQRVVVFIHGIIGDTTTSTAVLQQLAERRGETFIDRYQVVLTFDYENLGTKIDETAKNLLQKLRSLDCRENGKTLHVFAHSMGGLVSRWMIEQEGGDEVVDHLFTFGTPHGGSPWSNVFELITTGVTYAINGATATNFWLLPLLGVQRLWKASQTTLEEMKPGGTFIQRLNDGAVAKIPYTLIAGDTQLIQSEDEAVRRSFLKRLIYRFRRQPHYALLDMMLFKTANDIAVSLESQQAVRGDSVRKPAPIPCDHLSYFTNEACVALIDELLE